MINHRDAMTPEGKFNHPSALRNRLVIVWYLFVPTRSTIGQLPHTMITSNTGLDRASRHYFWLFDPANDCWNLEWQNALHCRRHDGGGNADLAAAAVELLSLLPSFIQLSTGDLGQPSCHRNYFYQRHNETPIKRLSTESNP
jgi:hypothetical protein